MTDTPRTNTFPSSRGFLLALLPPLFGLGGALPMVGAELSFNRDIRPILSENCFLCHGQDPEHRGGDLRLDVREEAVAAREEGAAIVPGKPAESAILKRILSTDPDVVMPPPKAHLAALKPTEIRTLEKWIEEGAAYEPHWAFVPPVKAALPEGAPDHPVDAFVLARLKTDGISPASAADPETLVRRVHLDLTGLPPGPADIDRYLTDTSPDRWQHLVDRLMESPHFAERMAMPWLDAARYSDTHGFSIDDHRDMWGWRDWVIHAFAKNQPYDQFLTEQIAGDLITGATPDQIAATGFLRNGMNTHEGGIIEEEYRTAATIDKVDAVATSMLGLTMKCAQCHDHKYDPISQREYFQFYAFFNSSSEPGKGGVNSSTKPVMSYTSPLGDGGMAGLKSRIAELEHLKIQPSAPIVAARDASEKKQPVTARAAASSASFPWTQFDPANAKWIWSGQPTAGQAVTFQREVIISDPVKEAWLFATADDEFSLAINGKPAGESKHWKQPARHAIDGLLRTGTNLITVTAKNYQGTAGFLAMLAWRTDTGWQTLYSDSSWETRSEAGKNWAPAFAIANFGSLPWKDVTAEHRDPEEKKNVLAAALATAPSDRSASQWNIVNQAFIASKDPLAPELDNILKSLEVEIKVLQSDLKRGQTTVMVMDHKPDLRKTHLLVRGAYDQPGEEVGSGVPAVLPPLDNSDTATRLDLAKWIVRPDHPLTARVAVNRTWQMIFGRGLVETAGDFGNQGSWPTHPELLDWLAVDFVENDWDLRHLLRVILSSDTYRRSAASTPGHLEKDPRNEFLARSPRPRLPAEIIRDQALAASGLLDPSIGGPGVHPPQPDLWSEISHFGHPTPFTAQKFYPGRDRNIFRRSLYTFWKRTSPPPAMALFDAPTRETCAVVRSNTNTPLQALVLWNETQFVEAGRALGRRMIAEGGETPAARVAFGFRLVTGREPTAQEHEVLNRSLSRHLNRYSAEEAAYAMTGATLLNLDETISRP
ncbi:MAG: DUF1553 domain-containing protein [Verrucomicrobiota bacterium]